MHTQVLKMKPGVNRADDGINADQYRFGGLYTPLDGDGARPKHSIAPDVYDIFRDFTCQCKAENSAAEAQDPICRNVENGIAKFFHNLRMGGVLKGYFKQSNDEWNKTCHQCYGKVAHQKLMLKGGGIIPQGEGGKNEQCRKLP